MQKIILYLFRILNGIISWKFWIFYFISKCRRRSWTRAKFGLATVVFVLLLSGSRGQNQRQTCCASCDEHFRREAAATTSDRETRTHRPSALLSRIVSNKQLLLNWCLTGIISQLSIVTKSLLLVYLVDISPYWKHS